MTETKEVGVCMSLREFSFSEYERSPLSLSWSWWQALRKGKKVWFGVLLKGCRSTREKQKARWLLALLARPCRTADSCPITTHRTSFCGLWEIAECLHFIQFVFLDNLPSGDHILSLSELSEKFMVSSLSRKSGLRGRASC